MSKLVILGLLMDKAMHGYELKKILESKESTKFSKMPSSTLYYGLDSLEKQGCLQKESRRMSNRPEQQVYSITDQGKKLFKELLQKSAMKNTLAKDPFDSVVCFFDHLDKSDMKQILLNRKQCFEEVLKNMKKTKHKSYRSMTICEKALFLRGMKHLQAEIEWIDSILK